MLGRMALDDIYIVPAVRERIAKSAGEVDE